MRPRIYADFLNADGDGTSQWLRLICRRTFDDLAKNKLELKEGLGVTFYADDTDDDGNYDELEADGACHFDAKCQYWFGRINWNAIRHASDLRLLYNHIAAKSPQGIQYSEAVKLMLCLFCTLDPLLIEMRTLKLTKEALAEVFSKFAADGRIVADEEARSLPSDIASFKHWEDLMSKLMHGQLTPDISFRKRISKYV